MIREGETIQLLTAYIEYYGMGDANTTDVSQKIYSLVLVLRQNTKNNSSASISVTASLKSIIPVMST